MLKEQRWERIMELVETRGVVKTTEVTELLGVTPMTARRDLQMLEELGKLERIHGGAKSLNMERPLSYEELSHLEKKQIRSDEKRSIARKAAELIRENATVYIGPGTTNELIYDYIDVNARIFTNSYQVFERFKNDNRFELMLIGGRYRERTGAFVGSFTNDIMSRINVSIAFVGTNGVNNERITTANEEEGACQKIILDNAQMKYILCDSSKVGRVDLFDFYRLDRVEGLITDHNISETTLHHYSAYTEIIVGSNEHVNV
ncbi:DeoR/GlpR family DNA-binding transcription regulator [Exiguobacterium sp. s150]|uniref:DeoR/GlpR family DNA-binding transcription regulator n=1 Tax=Exiguobacterium sp. s150 TaxID=2751221 RepID=UPI001BE7C9F3|nr:DeoR/GlpR family DNA-binding transcription regulator [Exiguobacterium sp. s150]